MRYTVKQACDAVQVSDRTLRRAIKTGELPAQREPWGAGDRLTVDPGDLAAWAEATGKPMAPVGNPGHEGRQAVAAIGTVPEVATPATPAEDRQRPANLGEGGGQGSAPIGAVPILATPAEVDALRGTVRALEVERDFLRRVLENVTKGLPAGQPEADPWKVYAQELEQWQALGWWARRKHRRPEPPK